MLKAVTRSARLVDDKLAEINTERVARGQSTASVAYYFDHYATNEDTEVSVMEEDFLQAKRELVPSVSVEELQHYERVRSTFEGGAKKYDNQSNGNGPQNVQPDTRGASVPRAKLNELMKRAQSGKGKSLTMNGHGYSGQVTPTQAVGGASDGDDDYVIRTDRMSLNNAPARPPSSKGKGKGKGRDTPGVDGSAETNGASEDLYD